MLQSANVCSGATKGGSLPWEGARDVSLGWSYLENNQQMPPGQETAFDDVVDLPHTWNAQDTLRTADYRRDASWYGKNFFCSANDLKQRSFLRFGAAGQEAEVFVNGRKMGAHAGGYAAFCVEVTDALMSGDNWVAVRVSNAENPALGPISADFTFYGGLYRRAHWISAPQICLARNYRSGSGVRVWSEHVSADVADLRVVARVDAGEIGQWAAPQLRLVAELTDPSGKIVSTGNTLVAGATDVGIPITMRDVVAPQLWSPDSPHLYTLRVQLYDAQLDKQGPQVATLDSGRLLDELTVSHGFRSFRFTADGKFFLNGSLYPLRGVNRHQDLQGYGNALSDAQHEHDIRIIKEVGANWVRLAHYQQDDLVLDLCDRLGLLVWEEIPVINAVSDDPAMTDNYEIMLVEMIEQHHNHPSVMTWSIQNEILLRQDESFYEAKKKLVTHLAGVARREVSHRPISQVFHGSKSYAKLGLPELTDLIGYNLYQGWYDSRPADLSGAFANLKALAPDKPHLLTEYGAGSDLRIHAEAPRRMDFSEEWHTHYLESYLDQFDTMEVCGTAYWNLFDFGSATRGDSLPHVNQKGLVAFDHVTKKDAWYLLKSRWSAEPVLYLCSPRFAQREGDSEKTYRVYTNHDEVELFHQGRSLGSQTSEFRWQVELEEGENLLLARGQNAEEHGFTVFYTAAGETAVADSEPTSSSTAAH